MTDAQLNALRAVQEGRIFRFPSSGAWVKREGIHGTTLNGLLRNGLIELEPRTGEPWVDAKLSKAGREALAQEVSA